tara:strand:- start:61 stop:522 length:462 start_codon:yes stop_codon:yes gene_type:complete
MKKTVIFDLDGTLALIDKRRVLSTDDGKMNWGKFFDPKNIDLDQPNLPVIKMAQMLHSQGFEVIICSGRSDKTKDATIDWLKKHDVPFDILHMRPTSRGHHWHFMPDDVLKQHWLDHSINKSNVFAVFDDRQQVVDMWRDNGLTVFQVAKGDF